MPDGARRWPVHPEPAPGEALTSWLGRLAGLYRLSVEQLLTHNLGPASAQFDVVRPRDADLDYQAPAAVLRALTARTGIAVGRLRRMTISGCVPWLADTLDPADGQKAFSAYVRQDSVLLPPGRAGYHVVNHWVPWLPARSRPWRTARRVCPTCPADRGILLLAALPLMISCAEHGCRLERVHEVRRAHRYGGADDPPPGPRRRRRAGQAHLRRLCVPAAASADSALTWQDCGDGMRCGQLGVPADWTRPRDGERITLGLAMLPAVDQARKKGTLLVNLGGPAPQIGAFRAGRAAFADLAQQFDVVVFDPRGFGRSSGISCPVPAPHTEAWVYPDRASYTAYTVKNRRFGQECTAAAGPLAGHVNSWQKAHDMDAIRAALDEPKLTYFGTSYGTVLGQAYAELFPDRVGRMYLDSVRDHTNRSVLDGLLPRARALESNLHRFASWCQDEKTCALHGRDVVTLWDELIAKASKQPIPAPGAGQEVTVNASFIVSAPGSAWSPNGPAWPTPWPRHLKAMLPCWPSPSPRPPPISPVSRCAPTSRIPPRTGS